MRIRTAQASSGRSIYRFLVHTARNVASALAGVHARSCVIGDIIRSSAPTRTARCRWSGRSRSITEALGRGDGKRGEAYIEKIIQYPIPLRPLLDRDVKMLIDAALKSQDLVMMEQEEHEKQIRSTLIGMIRPPRDVKRLIGA